MLLVLDNCEHLIDVCAALAERLLMGCPRVRLLATSRERLRIGAETIWRVPSLPGPDPRATIGLEDLVTYPAVELFVERAQALQPDFALSPATVSSMAGICARLEGLPLALELAAARVSALSLAQILERLDDSFRVLFGGSRSAPTRQQTLRATLDWSHDLLSAAEQAVFRRLAVFSGGWSLEAAEVVCTDPTIPSANVLELLTHLVDKSLVVVAEDERIRRSRYRLLEPIRQYARDQLVASGELDLVARQHAAFFLAFAEPLGREAGVGGARRDAAADAIVADYGNLLAALRRALDTRDAELALRLAWSLEFVWKWRLPIGEGRPWVEEVLALPGAEAPTPARAVSLLTAAQLAWGRGDYAAADRYYVEANTLARTLGDPWIVFVVQVDQGNAAQQRGDYAAARHFWQEGLLAARAGGLQSSEAVLLMNLGRLQVFEGNYAVGRMQCEEALALARKIDDVWVVWNALNALALAALAQDDLATARAFSFEGLKLKLDPTWQIRELFVLGQIAIAEGEYRAAREHLIHALGLLENTDDPVATALIVETVGRLASHLGHADTALRLAAAAEAARDVGDVAISRSIGYSHFPLSRALHDRWLIPFKKSVDAEDASRWWAEGYALSLGEAVALAKSMPLTAVSSPEPSTVRGVSGAVTPRQPDMAGLTAREAEVLRLVAKGQSNKEIAAELVLSVRTVERHITNLYGKIAARGKADATAYAILHGLV
jgi:predicted ATPase/DNA-binding CsgD family transcriptional regulator